MTKFVEKFSNPSCLIDQKGRVTDKNKAFQAFIEESKLSDPNTLTEFIKNVLGKKPKHISFTEFDSHIRKKLQTIPLENNKHLVMFDSEILKTAKLSGVQGNYHLMMKLFRDTVSEVYDSIIITDLDDTIIFVNNSFTKTYGYSNEEMVGKKSSEFWKNHQIEPENININEDTLFRQGFHGELLNKKKDGTYFPVLLSTTLIKDETGKPYATVGLSRDISEEKQIRVQLNESKIKAEEASKLKANLMANMSHEVRTPLTGIIGFASILYDQLLDNEDLLFYVENIKSSGERLLETMNNILMVSEIESNKTKLRFVDATLHTIVQKSVNFNRALANKTNLTISVIGDKTLTAYTDELLLYQILNIILNNALKFTEEGGVEIKIFEEDKNSCISVKDTGVGISEDFLGQIYEAFSQESAGIRRKYQGVGLGLNICKKYTQLIQGHIEVYSKKGVGSTFIIKLPKRASQIDLNV